MEKKIISFLMILFISLNLFSQDTTKDSKEIKFPGNLSIDFNQKIGWDACDNKSYESNYSGSGNIYSKTSIEAGISFNIKDIYTIKPWLLDKLTSRFYPLNKKVYDSAIYKDQTSDISGSNIKNDFEYGISNLFTIKNIMDIELNLGSKISTKVYFDDPAGSPYFLDVIFKPSLSLSGSYDFGFNWSIWHSFNFNFIPANYGSDAGLSEFDSFELEGDYKLGLEFFHFIKQIPEAIKAEFFTQLYVDMIFYNDKNKCSELGFLETNIGFNFTFWDITSTLAFNLTAGGGEMGNSNDPYVVPIGVRPGIKASLGYTKNSFNISLGYTGNILTNPKRLTESGKWTTPKEGTYDKPQWENNIEIALGFSL